MSDCGKISKGVAKNCDNPVLGGADDRLILFNLSDWKDCTIGRNVTNNNIIESITLPSGVVGFEFIGQNNSNTPKAALKKGKYLNTYIHETGFIALTKDAETKDTLEKLPQGKYVAVVTNNYDGNDGESKYEVYGEKSGLQCTILEADLQDADTQGAYKIMLASVEPGTEPHLPATIFNTDLPTTKAIVDSLV